MKVLISQELGSYTRVPNNIQDYKLQISLLDLFSNIMNVKKKTQYYNIIKPKIRLELRKWF